MICYNNFTIFFISITQYRKTQHVCVCTCVCMCKIKSLWKNISFEKLLIKFCICTSANSLAPVIFI